MALNPQAKTSADLTLFTDKVGETSEKAGFVIDGPGEYEIKGVFVKGFLVKEGERYKSTYLVLFEGIKLCFLGALAPVEDIEDVDILFVPVDGDAAAAYKFAVSLEPALAIPMRADEKALTQFVKEGGEKIEPLEKLVVKKKDLEGKKGEIVVLKEE